MRGGKESGEVEEAREGRGGGEVEEGREGGREAGRERRQIPNICADMRLPFLHADV